MESVDDNRGTITSIQITEVKSRQSRLNGAETTITAGGVVTMKPKTINMSYDPFSKPKKKYKK